MVTTGVLGSRAGWSGAALQCISIFRAEPTLAHIPDSFALGMVRDDDSGHNFLKSLFSQVIYYVPRIFPEYFLVLKGVKLQ